MPNKIISSNSLSRLKELSIKDLELRFKRIEIYVKNINVKVKVNYLKFLIEEKKEPKFEFLKFNSNIHKIDFHEIKYYQVQKLKEIMEIITCLIKKTFCRCQECLEGSGSIADSLNKGIKCSYDLINLSNQDWIKVAESLLIDLDKTRKENRKQLKEISSKIDNEEVKKDSFDKLLSRYESKNFLHHFQKVNTINFSSNIKNNYSSENKESNNKNKYAYKLKIIKLYNPLSKIEKFIDKKIEEKKGFLNNYALN